MDGQKLSEAARAYCEAVASVLPWCEQLMRLFRFDEVKNLELAETGFSFRIYWHGPYQSEDYRYFKFPYDELKKTPGQVYDRLEAESEDAETAARIKRDEASEESDRKTYESLKRRFEGQSSTRRGDSTAW